MGFGSEFDSQNIASYGDIALVDFSLLGCDTTTTILTDKTELKEHLQHFLSDGIKHKRFWNTDIKQPGYNFSISNISASYFIQILKEIDQKLQKQQQCATALDHIFKDEKLFLTHNYSQNSSGTHLYYPIILNPELQCPKEDIYKELLSKGIDVEVFYKPIYQYSCFEKRHLNVTNDFYRSILLLPLKEKDTSSSTTMAQDFLDIIHNYNFRGCSF